MKRSGVYVVHAVPIGTERTENEKLAVPINMGESKNDEIVGPANAERSKYGKLAVPQMRNGRNMMKKSFQ